MSSSMLQYASQESGDKKNSGKNGDEQLELLRSGCELTASDLSLEADSFLKAAISLKDQVVEMTWGRRGRGGSFDPTVYSGIMGTAFTCLRSYQATGNHCDLQLCSEIADACAAAAHISSRHVSFLCGRGGVYALGAVSANYRGDQKMRDLYLDYFLEMAQERALPVGPDEGGLGISYDLLYGRAGFLWAALFINKHLGDQTIPTDLLMPVVEAVLAGGRAGASDIVGCPLMYRWHGTRYWGAAHGLAGILHVLLHFPLNEDDIEDIKTTLRYMMSHRFPRSGNYPVSEGIPRDKLVQWSHGASGIAITMCKASEVLPDDWEFRNAAIEAGEVVWKSGLVKKEGGLADGTAGNAYTFLSLLRLRLTGESIYEERAKAFATYLYQYAYARQMEPRCNEVDHTYSLFQGLAGTACLWFDMAAPHASRFPGYEI